MPRALPWTCVMYLRAVLPDSTGMMALNDLKRPIQDSIRTERDGQAYLTLAAGAYLLLDRDRVDQRRYRRLLKDHAKPRLGQQAIDKECLRRWLHGPFGVTTISTGDTMHLDLPLFDKCPWDDTPCLPYFGPYPP